jgi:hypothetical protein
MKIQKQWYNLGLFVDIGWLKGDGGLEEPSLEMINLPHNVELEDHHDEGSSP